jgi:hypothetical protein
VRRLLTSPSQHNFTHLAISSLTTTTTTTSDLGPSTHRRAMLPRRDKVKSVPRWAHHLIHILSLS